VEVGREHILSTDRVANDRVSSIAPREIEHLNVLSGRR
jgi:hypothetical protein